MSFSSIEFLLFLPLCFFAYFFLPQRMRRWLLLAASYGFYGIWNLAYIPLLLGSSLIDYWCGHRIHGAATPLKRKVWLWLGLAVNLGTLFLFKYSNFVGANLRSVGIDYPYHDLLLPIGLSFYTLQTLSYTFDVYRGRIKPETDVGYFLLFVSFFPQLVAGPIERSGKLLPQLKHLSRPTVYDFRYGGILILWGFFLKLAIADNLTPFINGAYFGAASASAWVLWGASFLAMVKVYCDFMAYSEIARGTARLFGVQLTKNFNRPMLANNIRGFWQRWHISLTRWVIDYVQVPLMRRFPREPQRSLVAIGTMVLIGLWHGAGWNFVLFGVYHGVLMVLWNPLANVCARILPLGKNAQGYCGWVTMLGLVIFSGPMFFITDTAQLFSTLAQMLNIDSLPNLSQLLQASGKLGLLLAIPAMVILAITHWREERGKGEWQIAVAETGSLSRWGVVACLISATVLAGNFTNEPFVYFNF